MDGTWLTYHELAERLGVSVQAARRRVLRSRWSRQRGNDGKARVLLPADVETEPAPARRRDSASDAHAHGAATISALESHIKTLQADNEALTQDLGATRADLSAHVASLKTENERLAGQLAGAEARAGEESARTAEALAAFQALAERLEEMAAARRPWWRRLVG